MRRTILSCFLLSLLLISCDVANPTPGMDKPTVTPSPTATVPKVAPPAHWDITIEPRNVSSGGPGTYRYYFVIHNLEDKPFPGLMKITIQTGDVPASTGTFLQNRVVAFGPNGEADAYLDSKLSPPPLHMDPNDCCYIDGYTYEALISGSVVASGSGKIAPSP